MRSSSSKAWRPPQISPSLSLLAVIALGACSVDDRLTATLDPAAGLTDAGGDAPETLGGSRPGASPGGGSSEAASTPGGSLEPSALLASVESFDFGPSPVGVATPTLQWRITNGGASEVSGLVLAEGIEVGGTPPDFEIEDGCGDSLAAGASCTISVRFIPPFSGAHSRALFLRWPGGSVRLGILALGLPWLELRVTGNGRVTSQPLGINCPGTCRAAFDPSASIVLEATAGLAQRFSGWSAAECSALGPCRLALPVPRATERVVEARFADPLNNLVFISSQGYSPVLGGVAPYDAACNTLATAAGINTPNGNGFIAAMSDSSSHFIERLAPGVRGWTRMDGRAFADTREEMVTLGVVYNPVYYTELGIPGSGAFMSGTLVDGTLGLHCDGWSSTSAELTEGDPFRFGPGNWMGIGSLPISGARACDPATLRRIVCLGNTATAPLVRTPRAGKRIWLSNTTLFVGGISPDEHCDSERPSGVTSGIALIAGVGRAASDRLDPEADYVRPDGELVGTGQELIVASRPTADGNSLDSGMWQSADGRYLREEQFDLQTWSGSTALDRPGTDESTCGDWLDPSGNANVGNFGVTNFQFWSRGGTGPCSASNYVMCVEPF